MNTQNKELQLIPGIINKYEMCVYIYIYIYIYIYMTLRTSKIKRKF